jgi:hypothetical protein
MNRHSPHPSPATAERQAYAGVPGKAAGASGEIIQPTGERPRKKKNLEIGYWTKVLLTLVPRLY